MPICNKSVKREKWNLGKGGKGPGQGRKGAVRAPLASSVSNQQKDEGEGGEELDTPAARIMARRESRAAMPDRLKVAAPDDSSDEEWNGDDDEDEEEDGRVYLDASKCGRVRLHAVQGPAQSSSGLGVDDERRKSLADKGWARE